MVGKPHHRYRADGVIAPHHLEERLLAEALAVQLPLERLVPSPALRDVWPHRGAFGLERIAQRLFVLRQQMKADVGRQIGDMQCPARYLDALFLAEQRRDRSRIPGRAGRRRR
jgi:hypothetical protein